MVYYIIACHKEIEGEPADEHKIESMVHNDVLGSGRSSLGECYSLTQSVSYFGP